MLMSGMLYNCERESKCATACCFHCLSFKSLLFSFVFVFVFATFLSCLLLPYSCLFTGCFYWNPLKMIFSRFFLFFSSFAFVFEFVYMIFFFCLLFPFSFFLSFQSISIFFPEDFSFSAQTLTQAALKPETETGIPPPWEDFFCTIVAADALYILKVEELKMCSNVFPWVFDLTSFGQQYICPKKYSNNHRFLKLFH